jgi:hypothetical protein
MKLPSFFLAAHLLCAQAYVTGGAGTPPVSRVSFLREQFGSYDPTLILDFPLTGGYQATTWTDRTGKYNASLNNTQQTAVVGKIGPWSPYFNHSVTNYLSVSPTPTIPTTFTVVAWVHANLNAGGYNRIVDTEYTHNFALATDSASTPTKYELVMNGSTGGNNCSGGSISNPVITGKAWPTNPWDFLAFTFTTTSGTLYVNGVSVATGSNCTFTGWSGGAYPMQIGNCADGTCTADHWDGEIQGVRIWSRALSASEIAAIYAAENH